MSERYAARSIAPQVVVERFARSGAPRIRFKARMRNSRIVDALHASGRSDLLLGPVARQHVPPNFRVPMQNSRIMVPLHAHPVENRTDLIGVTPLAKRSHCQSSQCHWGCWPG